MTFLQAAILSIVEGVTEFLPVSSTGHLVLVSRLLDISQTEFVKSFEIIIQVGAILAVLMLYGKRFLISKKTSLLVVAAFIPTAVIGLALYKIVKTVLLGNETVTLATLFIGGIIIIAYEWYLAKKPQALVEPEETNQIESLSYPKAVTIGLIQSVSIIPGVSRSAATIIGGMITGLDRKTATEFSFLLAVPTLIAASGLDIIKTSWQVTGQEIGLLAIGLLGSFVTALVVIRYFIKFVQHNSLIVFGFYRIIIAILFWLVIAH